MQTKHRKTVPTNRAIPTRKRHQKLKNNKQRPKKRDLPNNKHPKRPQFPRPNSQQNSQQNLSKTGLRPQRPQLHQLPLQRKTKQFKPKPKVKVKVKVKVK